MSQPSPPRFPLWVSFETIEQTARIGRAQRLASGKVMTYLLDGWAVDESPGGRIERLASAAIFCAEDFPSPA
jgi:hypothetical protein